MLPLPFRSAKELAAAIRTKKVGALELLELYIARMQRFNPRLNAIIATDLEGARKRARAADRALAKRQVWGPLHGVPMTIKESFDVAGLPTTWGHPALKGNIAKTNALLVDRMLAAGVVVFGKTNVPLWLADYQSYNAVYGTTNNPWDVTRAPGGSSGGSAAALAAGLTGIETGSDIGSSIRNPAHYCGVFGLKPTWTIVPPRGHTVSNAAAVGDIAVVGPMARSADDLDIALAATAGPDAVDAVGWQLRLPASRKKRLGEFRVAVMLTAPESEVDREVQDRLQALADFLSKKRVKVSDHARPEIDTAEAHRVYVHLLRAATSGRLTTEEVDKQAGIARALPREDESYYARMLRANTAPHRDWLVASELRHRMRFAWARFFEAWDLLLCPVAATAATPHDQQGERWERTIRVNGRDVPATDQLFWAGYSGMAYLPSAVAPCGFTPSGLPVGVQIIAPQYGDRTAVHFARLLEREFQPFVPPAGYE